MKIPGAGSWYFRIEASLTGSEEILGEGPFGALLAVLGRSKELGFLGPGPVEPHIDRALDALRLISSAPAAPRRFLDLGSGGGLPGLPLALALPGSQWMLLDGSVTRTRFLRDAVAELGLTDRVAVETARAEEAGRRGDLRGTFDVVVVRSFGPPAVTAECAAPFLVVGGVMVVAEPPEGSEDRWPEEGLRRLELARGARVADPSAFQVLRQAGPCPDRYPRRTGIPAKRPLF